MTAAELWRKLVGACDNPGAALFKAALGTGRRSAALAATAWPRTYHQKLRYKMVRDRRPLLGVFADKATSRAYVAERVGARYAIPTIAVLERAEQLRDVAFPERYVVKVSHASGGIVVVEPSADPGARLPAPGLPHSRHRIHPASLDRRALEAVVAAWLDRPYVNADRGEWAYTVQRPRVLVEEYLEGPGGAAPRDVKLFVFHGRCGFYRVDTPDGATKRLDHFDRDGTPLPVRFGEYSGDFYPTSPTPPPPPRALAEMRRVAEALAADVDFVRVDLLELEDRFVVTELTNYPTNGTGRFRPRRFDRELGAGWRPGPY
jgi:hypothetical protein